MPLGSFKKTLDVKDDGGRDERIDRLLEHKVVDELFQIAHEIFKSPGESQGEFIVRQIFFPLGSEQFLYDGLPDRFKDVNMNTLSCVDGVGTVNGD